MLLAPSYGRIPKHVCLLLILQCIKPVAKSLPLVFSEAVTAGFLFLPVLQALACFLYALPSFLAKLAAAVDLRSIHRELTRVGDLCRRQWALPVPAEQLKGQQMKLFQRLTGEPSGGVHSTVGRNQVLLMPSESLLWHFANLLTPPGMVLPS